MAGGSWLTVEGYKAWARIPDSDTTDDVAISEASAAAAEAIELRAPKSFKPDPETGDPPPTSPMLLEAGRLLTNRLLARRNSPDGVVGVSDVGTATVLSYDADINVLVSPKSEMVLG
jgi:hypothetical protein